MDLTALTISQLAVLLSLVTIIDVAGGLLDAARAGTLSAQYIAVFLDSHVLKRVFPIIGLALISKTLGEGPDGATLWTLALGGLVAYVLETIRSLALNLPTTTSTGLPSSVTPS
jgi:hypothetical protein